MSETETKTEPKQTEGKGAPDPKAKAKPAAAPAEPVRFIAASESRFAASAEYTFPLTSYVPVAGTPLEHLLEPKFWANIKALKAGCRIWVVPEDEAWYAELYVRKVGQGFAMVQVLRSGALDAVGAEPGLTEGYEVEYKGPLLKHRVVRKADGQVLKDKLDSAEAAHEWLRQHKRMLAA